MLNNPFEDIIIRKNLNLTGKLQRAVFLRYDRFQERKVQYEIQRHALQKNRKRGAGETDC